jgi:hypothetical protein
MGFDVQLFAHGSSLGGIFTGLEKGCELYRYDTSKPRLYAVCGLEFCADGGNIAAPRNTPVNPRIFRRQRMRP